MNKKKVRVRYAPSPTGYLHIGGARSALFNYLYAKHYGGDFVVRIEDTDIERNIAGAEESQIKDLIWLGIIPDESPENPNPAYAPYRQMEKLNVYKKYADLLIEKGYAYKCYCSEEELEISREAQLARGIASARYDGHCLHLTPEQVAKYEAEGREPTIRIHMPKNKTIAFNDLVRGKVSFNTDDIGDWIIVKSNGIPTYNFAVVIDDYMMAITHVMRGEEHLSNTPKQIQLYDYFGWEAPEFGHMTIIVNESGKKLSKRDLNILQFMSQYRELGYLPEAIFNFILLLGWAPSDNREIFTIEEAIAVFDGNGLSSSPSKFDPDKMMWMNSQYIKNLPERKYIEFISTFINKIPGINCFSDQQKAYLASLYQNEIKFGAEIIELATPLVAFRPLAEGEDLIKVKDSLSQEVFKLFIDLLQEAVDLEPETLKSLFKNCQKTLNVKGSSFFMPLRLALTGQTHGVELVSIIKFLGKAESCRRIRYYL
ncbi:MAG: glutamate--tRNA ligase [Bacilli bacterium]